MRRLTALSLAAVLAPVLLVGGCESESERAAEKQLDSSQRQLQCSANAKAVERPANGVPANLPVPPRSTLFHVDDRGSDGVVMSLVTPAPFKDVLSAMNAGFGSGGYRITEGETEAHDAEANWTTDGYRGRWAIREVGSDCPGDTLITILTITS